VAATAIFSTNKKEMRREFLNKVTGLPSMA
jgi:hypothetical protein